MDPFEHLPEKCTLREAALALGISKETLRRAVQAQALPSHLTRGPKGPQLMVEKRELVLWHAGRMGLSPIPAIGENQVADEAVQAPQDRKSHSENALAAQAPQAEMLETQEKTELHEVLGTQAPHATQANMALVALASHQGDRKQIESEPPSFGDLGQGPTLALSVETHVVEITNKDSQVGSGGLALPHDGEPLRVQTSDRLDALSSAANHPQPEGLNVIGTETDCADPTPFESSNDLKEPFAGELQSGTPSSPGNASGGELQGRGDNVDLGGDYAGPAKPPANAGLEKKDAASDLEPNNEANELASESSEQTRTHDRQMNPMVHAAHEAEPLSLESNDNSAQRSLGLSSKRSTNKPDLLGTMLEALDQGSVGLDEALVALRLDGSDSDKDPHVTLVADAIQLFNRVLDRSRDLEQQLEAERAARNRAELRAFAAFQELERLRRPSVEADEAEKASDTVQIPAGSGFTQTNRARVGVRDADHDRRQKERRTPQPEPAAASEPEAPKTFGLRFRKWLLGY